MARLGGLLFGALVLGSAAVGLFFFRYWRATRDRLLWCFAVAFWLLGAHWLLLGLTDPSYEHRPVLYVIRFAAFVMVLLGIVEKNRAERR
jgi:hypothetical protein